MLLFFFDGMLVTYSWVLIIIWRNTKSKLRSLNEVYFKTIFYHYVQEKISVIYHMLAAIDYL